MARISTWQTVLADDFAEAAIGVVRRAVGERAPAVGVESAAVVDHALFDVRATISAKKRSWVPRGKTCVTLHSRLTGHSAMSGAFTTSAGSSVSSAVLSLSTSRPSAGRTGPPGARAPRRHIHDELARLLDDAV